MSDYRLVALTPVVIKCFEKMVLSHINGVLRAKKKNLHYAFRNNRLPVDSAALAKHIVLVDTGYSYARVLFVDFSSDFHPVVPLCLVAELRKLGLLREFYDWLLSFPTDRRSIKPNLGVQQGCCLSPALFSFNTLYCDTCHKDTNLLNHVNDLTLIDLITDVCETFYRVVIQWLRRWLRRINWS